MRIPAADLRAQHAALHDELLDAFQRVLGTSAFVLGPEVAALEREFAAHCEVPHAIGVANGAEAVSLALRAVGVGAGDTVSVPAFTFVATAEAVCHVGARPLFVIRCSERDALKTHLEGCGIAAAIHYPIPLHLQSAFRVARSSPRRLSRSRGRGARGAEPSPLSGDERRNRSRRLRRRPRVGNARDHTTGMT